MNKKEIIEELEKEHDKAWKEYVETKKKLWEVCSEEKKDEFKKFSFNLFKKYRGMEITPELFVDISVYFFNYFLGENKK